MDVNPLQLSKPLGLVGPHPAVLVPPAARWTESTGSGHEAMLTALELRDLARERGLTQEALAERLATAQGNVSRILRRENMHVGMLRDVVEAMGGELRLTARFPDGEYDLLQFQGNGSHS